METKETVEMSYESPVITESVAAESDNKAVINVCDANCFNPL